MLNAAGFEVVQSKRRVPLPGLLCLLAGLKKTLGEAPSCASNAPERMLPRSRGCERGRLCPKTETDRAAMNTARKKEWFDDGMTGPQVPTL